MARRPREDIDDRPTILRDTWVLQIRDGAAEYKNCDSGETRSDPPPSHHIVMDAEAYMHERASFETIGQSSGFFSRKKMRVGLRPLRAGMCHPRARSHRRACGCTEILRRSRGGVRR